jgi:hypothetical protein
MAVICNGGNVLFVSPNSFPQCCLSKFSEMLNSDDTKFEEFDAVGVLLSK